jgi:hypothetical protein
LTGNLGTAESEAEEEEAEEEDEEEEEDEDEDEADEDQLMEDIYNGVLAIANIFARVMASQVVKDKDA